ncbi:MAG: hypothetical protein GW772_03305 [Flavobacteriia bacterium]|nr:hypothetical protein [Flavobacteriia bacterium]OIP46713.1 MAG: hypothetical protein AUK46_07745 [Flavobacteriaceae bacterium CG2_30_31_66]PIV95771.1 MAG: hypothetical protein COW43_11580 [Flavobacteriaceae bacterium CG17_big_fil_post_rev_8_21_14_2_50_31_13]PIX13551.1 MAG: hypothetical protein COZ74_05735 [Flavobacteriaceae bacterium CG_4_8_14_3_um_filter_31_8]PIY16161.1 MAG: hypothetical protein COZ16_00980 [Flavobacteriaceae bacterium CG_4_10_14_3_um_filter_31_253]PIZ11286.1 MAG: hypotheti
METTSSIDILTKKLKNAPESVIERVIDYVDALIEPTINKKPYNLSESQQLILDNQVNSEKSTYIEAEKFHTELLKKYEL